ncbi:hypothetical protein FRC12_000847 [Ceratobasidium sp. 428]|nr:hypothetical protein FRC09_001028 [Ceratobasidium sp. 395]KAG8776540.1 hypothetical protein FRC12_000847 [Ceratobasidium sp. 428]
MTRPEHQQHSTPGQMHASSHKPCKSKTVSSERREAIEYQRELERHFLRRVSGLEGDEEPGAEDEPELQDSPHNHQHAHEDHQTLTTLANYFNQITLAQAHWPN